jgi:competence protein ComEA
MNLNNIAMPTCGSSNPAAISSPVPHRSAPSAPMLQLRTHLKTLLLTLTMLFGIVAPQAYAAGPEPAIQAQPIVNINKASAAELSEALVGVGLKKAEEIVAWREQNGPFKSADDLAKVKGIGGSTVEKNRTRIRL